MNHHKFANSLLFVTLILLGIFIFFALIMAAKQSMESMAEIEKRANQGLELRAKIIEACFQKGGVPLLENGDLKDCKI